MKQIDHLIAGLRNHLIYRARLGVSTRVMVYTASQNTNTVLNAAGEIAHSILRGCEWDHSAMDESETALRRDILLKDLFYTKRIVVEVTQKPYPLLEGNYIELDCNNYDKLFFDMDMCQEVMLRLGLTE